LAAIEKDAPRGGRPAKIRGKVAAKIVEWTTQRQPPNAAHWSTRTLAAELGTSRAMVNRVWRANGLRPHLTRTFKLSNDRRFVEKLTDIVGLYLDPPEHALVLSVDEKSQIQALDRELKSGSVKSRPLGSSNDIIKNHMWLNSSQKPDLLLSILPRYPWDVLSRDVTVCPARRSR
jgi:transposase